MKKTLALVLTLALMLTLSLNVFAAPTPPAPGVNDKDGTATITLIEDVQNVPEWPIIIDPEDPEGDLVIPERFKDFGTRDLDFALQQLDTTQSSQMFDSVNTTGVLVWGGKAQDLDDDDSTPRTFVAWEVKVGVGGFAQNTNHEILKGFALGLDGDGAEVVLDVGTTVSTTKGWVDIYASANDADNDQISDVGDTRPILSGEGVGLTGVSWLGRLNVLSSQATNVIEDVEATARMLWEIGYPALP